MQKLSLKWFALLLVSSSVFMWRLIDFFDEAVNHAFHMTRGGLDLKGVEAEVLQLLMSITPPDAVGGRQRAGSTQAAVCLMDQERHSTGHQKAIQD